MVALRKNIAVIAIVLLLAGLAVYQNFAAADKEVVLPQETAPKPNYLAPAFSLGALDGNTYHAGGPRDKALLINFWASWCGPCEREAPDLKRLYDKYKDKIDFYAVNITQGDKLNDVKAFVQQHGFTFPVLLDTEGKAAELYRVYAIPTTFLVDRNGVIQDAFNLLNPDELEKRIKRIAKKVE